jgi:hypothetical protein
MYTRDIEYMNETIISTIKSHRYYHDGELTPFACRSSTLSLLPKVPLGWQPAWYFSLREVKPALSVPCRGPNP